MTVEEWLEQQLAASPPVDERERQAIQAILTSRPTAAA
jgi:hypothetical protein